MRQPRRVAKLGSDEDLSLGLSLTGSKFHLTLFVCRWAQSLTTFPGQSLQIIWCMIRPKRLILCRQGMLSMGSSPVSQNPSSLHVSQKDAHPVSKYACKGSKPKLDCRIGAMGEVSYHRVPTDQTPLPRCRSKPHPTSRTFIETAESFVGLLNLSQ
jgi:hypothetical protein